MQRARGWTFVVATLLTGCGQLPTQDASTLNYLSWDSSSVRSSTIADARKETINVCLQGSVTAPDLERSKTWARRAILTWLRTAKVIDVRVTSNVAYSCENRDLTINLRNGSGTSFASPSVSTIYMTRPYGTWTHELGHALAGLNDTYAGGAGSCKSGQPLSLMCWGAYGPRANPEEWSTMWPDDIAGMQANYRKIFQNELVAPEWAGDIDLEAPIDVERPWPEATVQLFQADSHDVTILAGGETAILVDDPNSQDL